MSMGFQFLRRGSAGMSGQMIRYFLSGWGAFAVDYLLMVLLKEVCGVHDAAAATVGYCVNTMLLYILSVTWIFDERRFSNRYLEIFLFASIGLVGMAFTYLLMLLFDGHLGMNYLVAKIVVAAIVTFWNLTAKKLLLFSIVKK
ncbi:MAG: GtrA family protein [bacterium]|uniref:GtrA family protein n=1 Tax=Candidatus Aphodosoma intestinipullorum TaxID=2840674 RepID=A0A940IE61_9BACT|nr:GtrA family protein [Candidatus Aphodosoma intestinipullorum]